MAKTNTKTNTQSKTNEQTETVAPANTNVMSKYEGLPTKSAKIRAMAADGMKTGAIAKLLGLRYQHVRNVLTQPLAKKTAA